MFVRRLVINNGSRTLCHPMQFVIIEVIYKIGGPQNVSPICHSQVIGYRQNRMTQSPVTN